MGILAELRRRRLFRVAALYVVGAWMVLQVFDLLFPRLGVPDAVMDLAFIGALLGFPVALVFGWIYDITPQGIVRTRPSGPDEKFSDLSLKRSDYFILSALLTVIAAIVYSLAIEVSEIPPESDEFIAAVEAPENSIAVLPFDNMSSDPDNEFFCDGISEEILNKLSALGDLHVIARTSSFALKDSGYDIPKIAAILGVRYLLQGSVRREGGQLRIIEMGQRHGGADVGGPVLGGEVVELPDNEQIRCPNDRESQPERSGADDDDTLLLCH